MLCCIHVTTVHTIIQIQPVYMCMYVDCAVVDSCADGVPIDATPATHHQ